MNKFTWPLLVLLDPALPFNCPPCPTFSTTPFLSVPFKPPPFSLLNNLAGLTRFEVGLGAVGRMLGLRIPLGDPSPLLERPAPWKLVPMCKLSRCRGGGDGLSPINAGISL